MPTHSAPLKGFEDPARLKACLTGKVRFSAVCVQQCTMLSVSIFQAGGVFFSPLNLAWTKRDNQDAAPKTESASRGHPKRKAGVVIARGRVVWRVISPSKVWQSVDAVTQATCSSVRGCSQRNGKEKRSNDSAPRRSVFALRNRAETQGMNRK